MAMKLEGRPTILFIEDEEEVRLALQGRLEETGYAIIAARNEAEAIQVLTSRQLDIGLILLNQNMHSEQVLAAGRRIRALAMLEGSVPVVVVPFEYEDALEGQDQTVGDNDYKTYMTETEQLTTLIERLLPV